MVGVCGPQWHVRTAEAGGLRTAVDDCGSVEVDVCAAGSLIGFQLIRQHRIPQDPTGAEEPSGSLALYVPRQSRV